MVDTQSSKIGYLEKKIREGDLSPVSLNLAGRMYQFAHIAEDIAAGATYHYSFVTPTDKEFVLFDRTYLLTNGDGIVYTRSHPTTVTHGDPILTTIYWNPSRPPESQMYSDSTNVTGGYQVIPELLDIGKSHGSAYGERGGVVVVNRNQTLTLDVTNNGSQASDFRLWLMWGEVDLAHFL